MSTNANQPGTKERKRKAKRKTQKVDGAITVESAFCFALHAFCFFLVP
jgi:hypothetical protein